MSRMEGGVCLEGSTQRELICLAGLPRGCLPGGGVCPGEGVYPGGVHAGIHTPPVNRIPDRCTNITLPQTSFAGSKKQQKETLVILA